MKKIILLFVLPLLTTSCYKAFVNGKLDGMWQLTSIDTLHYDNTITTDYEIKNEQVFYSVQIHLLSLRGGKGPYILGRFKHEKDSLFLYDLRLGSGESPCKLQDVKNFGLDCLEPRFGIKKLTHKEMILRSDSLTLNFRKY